jgi:hypothetical protein
MCRGQQDLFALSDGLNVPKGFFVMFTADPGYKSYTGIKGALFTATFTDVLKKRSTIWPLEKIFTETAKTVYHTKQGNPAKGSQKQQKPHHYKNCSEEIWLADEGMQDVT